MAPVEEVVATMGFVLRGGTFGDDVLSAVSQFLSAEPITDLRIREALGLMIAAPDFQYY